MIYPKNFENKIAFDEVRSLIKERCLSTLGKEMADGIAMSTNVDTINEWMEQTREFRRLQEEVDDFPLQYFFDVRKSISGIRPEGTHLEETELFDLRRSLDTINSIVKFLNRTEDDEEQEETQTYPYPALHRLTEDVMTFPLLIKRIDEILDKFGHICDNASNELLQIRRELSHTAGSISHTLNSILRAAQGQGLVDKDVTPTMRDGRLVIPVAPGLKRKIRGIVHDESATGKTVFIEPTEVVEANNRIRELEAEERREVIKILTDFTKQVRPHVNEILESYHFLAIIDLIRAKAVLAKKMKAFEPVVADGPHIDWIDAIHPLLGFSLEEQGKRVVPLDIMLSSEKRILIISGPNAGGKSVCLKTVGLLQYMLQCGVSIPINEHSKTGVFKNIMIDIGDEQSIENDLSTYSSHLMNMKNMMKQADDSTLLLIDEFGTGTEPQIGGAIAEAVLRQFCLKKTYGVITTHYQNLKHFAENHQGVVNGAMLYDRQEMRALFHLQIGNPGSSFAIEIARKTGIPEVVISEASEMVGSEYIQSDKYLQDIVRDKRYWEGKRQTIHQREKVMEQTIKKYESEIEEIENSRKEILKKAKEKADEILRQSNAKIENAIKVIKESQAEKEETRKVRDSIANFKAEVNSIDTTENDEMIDKKIKQIKDRKERHQKRKEEKIAKADRNSVLPREKTDSAELELKEGDTVRIKGQSTIGTIENISGKTAIVVFGDMRTKLRKERLEHATKPIKEEPKIYASVSKQTRDAIDEKKLNFKQNLDVRGMRGDEAINAVSYFIDDAIIVGMSRVRILHGTGSGILRQLIRQYLGTVPAVKDYHDEHIQFGGSGITIVDLE